MQYAFFEVLGSIHGENHCKELCFWCFVMDVTYIVDIVPYLSDRAILRDTPRMVRPLPCSPENTETGPSSVTLWTDELETIDTFQNFNHICGHLCLSKQYTADVFSWASFRRCTLGRTTGRATL